MSGFGCPDRHRYMKAKLLLIFLLLPWVAGAQSFSAKISDLSFMSGLWAQQHKWGYMEEYWSAPNGDNMVCSYRCIKDGKVIFYEFIVIEQTDNVPVMKLRHFKPGNIGWEDKDKPYEYPLIAMSKNKAVFKARDSSLVMTYERTGTKSLQITLTEKNKAGEWETTLFNYTTVQPANTKRL